MNRAKIDNLIAHLTAITNYAKDLHYNCSGESFYGKHLFADRLQDGIHDFIDQIKEVILLGHGFETLPSKEYLQMAIPLIPDPIFPDNSYKFENMLTLMLDTLQLMEDIEGLSRGDDNLIGNIAQEIQNNVGLLNIMFNNKRKN